VTGPANIVDCSICSMRDLFPRLRVTRLLSNCCCLMADLSWGTPSRCWEIQLARTELTRKWKMPGKMRTANPGLQLPAGAQIVQQRQRLVIARTDDERNLVFLLKLCRSKGGELEQIQFLLGHESILTTERYLGSEQNLKNAVNDALVFE
jgi:hypothetical protein